MMSRYKKILVVAMGIGMTAAVAVPSAYAARPNTLPAGTKVTGNLKSGTKMTFVGDIDGVPITVSCKTFTSSGTIPKKKNALTVNLTKPPTISGCTDSLGGTDTVKTNGTNGKWSLTLTKSAPYTMTLTIPKAGATFTSSIEAGCTITAAPTAAAGVAGSYDGTSTDTVKNASIPTSGSGCTSTSAKTSATVVLSPAPGPPPF
jgi:hypothetical protein